MCRKTDRHYLLALRTPSRMEVAQTQWRSSRPTLKSLLRILPVPQRENRLATRRLPGDQSRQPGSLRRYCKTDQYSLLQPHTSSRLATPPKYRVRQFEHCQVAGRHVHHGLILRSFRYTACRLSGVTGHRIGMSRSKVSMEPLPDEQTASSHPVCHSESGSPTPDCG